MALSQDSIHQAITSLTGLSVILVHEEAKGYAFKSGTTTATGLYKYGEWYTIDKDFVDSCAKNVGKKRPFFQ